MKAFSFEKLEVYKKSVLLSTGLIKNLSDSRNFKRKIMLGQVIRSATSVPLNIAEGCGRFHKKEMRQFLSIARGSLYETVAAMDILKELGELQDDRFNEFYELSIEVGKMLSALITSTMK